MGDVTWIPKYDTRYDFRAAFLSLNASHLQDDFIFYHIFPSNFTFQRYFGGIMNLYV